MKRRRETNRKSLEKSLIKFNLAECLGASVTSEQLSMLDCAKVSILPLLDVYYQYQLQEILRYVNYRIKIETRDQRPGTDRILTNSKE